jgi:hypothetical protein
LSRSSRKLEQPRLTLDRLDDPDGAERGLLVVLGLAVLFGNVARGDARPDSDVDVL